MKKEGGGEGEGDDGKSKWLPVGLIQIGASANERYGDCLLPLERWNILVQQSKAAMQFSLSVGCTGALEEEHKAVNDNESEVPAQFHSIAYPELSQGTSISAPNLTSATMLTKDKTQPRGQGGGKSCHNALATIRNQGRESKFTASTVNGYHACSTSCKRNVQTFQQKLNARTKKSSCVTEVPPEPGSRGSMVDLSSDAEDEPEQHYDSAATEQQLSDGESEQEYDSDGTEQQPADETEPQCEDLPEIPEDDTPWPYQDTNLTITDFQTALTLWRGNQRGAITKPHPRERATYIEMRASGNRPIIMTSWMALVQTDLMITSARGIHDIVIAVKTQFRTNSLSDKYASATEWADFMTAVEACSRSIAYSKGTVWIIDEPNRTTCATCFDRPGALLAGYLIRQYEMSSTLAIRTIGATIFHTGKWFDPKCKFNRALMAWEHGMTDFEVSRSLRDMHITPAEQEGMKPVAEDVMAVGETQTEGHDYQLNGTHAERELQRSMLSVSRSEGRPEFVQDSGIADRRSDLSRAGKPGMPSKRSKTKTQTNPNSKKCQDLRKKQPAQIALDRVLSGAKFCVNWGPQDGNWCDGVVKTKDDKNLYVQFAGDDGGVVPFASADLLDDFEREQAAKSLIAIRKFHSSTNVWRLDVKAKAMNRRMPRLAECARMAKTACEVAQIAFMAAVDISTVYKSGDVVEVPNDRTGAWQVAVVVTSALVDNARFKRTTLVQLINAPKPVQCDTFVVRHTRKSKRELLSLLEYAKLNFNFLRQEGRLPRATCGSAISVQAHFR